MIPWDAVLSLGPGFVMAFILLYMQREAEKRHRDELLALIAELREEKKRGDEKDTRNLSLIEQNTAALRVLEQAINSLGVLSKIDERLRVLEEPRRSGER